jgi:hypothetical protein
MAAVIAMAALPLTVAPPASAGTATPATASVSDPPPILRCYGPWPQGYRQMGGSKSCAECLARGDAGIARGDWLEYQCRAVPVGLDIVYYLFVR